MTFYRAKLSLEEVEPYTDNHGYGRERATEIALINVTGDTPGDAMYQIHDHADSLFQWHEADKPSPAPLTLPPDHPIAKAIGALFGKDAKPVGPLRRVGVIAPDEPAEHPEEKCGFCGGRNVAWTAPSPLWNEVMRGGNINGDEPFGGIVCPTCFAFLAEEMGVGRSWRLDAEWIGVELTTVTPSGRVWNRQTWRWDDPGRQDDTDEPATAICKCPTGFCMCIHDDPDPDREAFVPRATGGPIVITSQPGPTPAGIAQAVAGEIEAMHRRRGGLSAA